MQLPNPTCALSADPAVLRRIANELFDEDKTDRSHEDQRALEALFRCLIGRVLTHLFATREQLRSRATLEAFYRQAVQDLEKKSKSKLISTQSDTLIFAFGVWQELEDNGFSASDDTVEPTRIQAILTALIDKASKVLEDATAKSDPQPSPGDDKLYWTAFQVIDGLAGLPARTLRLPASDLERKAEPCVSFLRTIIEAEQKPGPDELMESHQPVSAAKRLLLVRCFELLCKLTPSDDCDGGQLVKHTGGEIVHLAEAILELHPGPQEQEKLLNAFREHVRFRKEFQAVCVKYFISDDYSMTRSGLLLMRICIKEVEIEAYKDSNLGQETLSALLHSALNNPDPVIFARSMECIELFLRDRSSLAKQHAVESIVINLPKLARKDPSPAASYLLATKIFTTLFLTHRARLHGRYHLVVRALQQFLSQLFTSTDYAHHHPQTPKPSPQNRLTVHHATAFARLLSLFCKPPHRHPNTQSSLLPEIVDESRREQAVVGQHVPVLLHQYCVQVLHGSLAAEGMKEALTPGLWEMVEAMEMHEANGVRVLSAGMNESERAVLRGVFEEWRRFGKWRGG